MGSGWLVHTFRLVHHYDRQSRGLDSYTRCTTSHPLIAPSVDCCVLLVCFGSFFFFFLPLQTLLRSPCAFFSLSRWLRWLLLTQTASPASFFSEKSWWRIKKKRKKKKNKLLSRRRDGGTRTRTLGARCALTRGLLRRSATLFYFVLQFCTCCRVPACEAGGEKEVDPRSGSVAGLVASLYTAAAAAAAVCECLGSHRDSALGSVQPQK